MAPYPEDCIETAATGGCALGDRSSRHIEAALRRTYDAMSSPKWVIAAGECACNGGEFGVSYASCGAVENIIPVDVTIPGCPPTPWALPTGIRRFLDR